MPVHSESRQPRISSSSAISRSSCARSLTCLLQLLLQRVAVDAVVVAFSSSTKSSISRIASRGTTHSATDSPRRPYCSRAYASANSRSGASTEPGVRERLPLPLLAEDLEDHAASREHDVGAPTPSCSRERRRSSSRSGGRRPVPGDDVLELVPVGLGVLPDAAPRSCAGSGRAPSGRAPRSAARSRRGTAGAPPRCPGT